MDFTPSRKHATKQDVNPLLELYPHDVQLYKVPPSGQITLVEFQDLAFERQKVLQLLEVTLAQRHESQEQLKLAFVQALKKDGYFHYARLVSGQSKSGNDKPDLEARRRDHISHFILRLAYCTKDDLQNYLITHETELFKLKFSSLSKEGVTQFLATSGINYSPISQEFKEANRQNLGTSTTSIRDADPENIDFYELPFDEVVDLISDRRVYIHKGIAYVPQTDLITVFLTHFRSNLSIELNRTRKFVFKNLDDERIQSFLKSLPECFAGMNKVIWNTDNTPISKLNDLSKTSYPLCMRIMHEQLMSTHHLRNTGRLQYGLFLKGIGVTLDDSVEFWRTELTKRENVSEDKFNKEYLYNIKYNYGKLGRRVDYHPHGCNKLISEPVGPGEVHGCPYKFMDTDELKKRLTTYKIPTTEMLEITKFASEGHYNLACTKYFECTHNQFPDRMFLHPNQYFAESRKLLTKGDTVKTEKESENVGMDVTSVTLSPEKPSQSIKVKVENNLDTSISHTPSRPAEKKAKLMDRKFDKKGPVNIEELLNDSD